MAKLNTKIVMLKGEHGKDGTNIKSVEKSASDVLTDTYTITLTDGSKSSFNVTNGKGISSIEKSSTNTYTINYNDGTTSTLTLDVDTELSTTSTNPVQNKAVAEGINSIQSQIVPTASIEIGETASKSYNAGDYLVKDGILYKVTKYIYKNNALKVGENITLATIGNELKEIKSSISGKFFELVGVAGGQTSITINTIKPLSEFNGFMLSIAMLPTTQDYHQLVIPSGFVTREDFELTGRTLLATNDDKSCMGKVVRIDDNTVKFFDLVKVDSAELIGFH